MSRITPAVLEAAIVVLVVLAVLAVLVELRSIGHPSFEGPLSSLH